MIHLATVRDCLKVEPTLSYTETTYLYYICICTFSHLSSNVCPYIEGAWSYIDVAKTSIAEVNVNLEMRVVVMSPRH